jgi:hypothetical protein
MIPHLKWNISWSQGGCSNGSHAGNFDPTRRRVRGASCGPPCTTLLARRLHYEGRMARMRLAAATAVTLLLAGCTLNRPDYEIPRVHVGEPAFTRTLEAHALSTPIGGNRAQLLLNGD